MRTEWLKLIAEWPAIKSKQPDALKNGCPNDLRPKIWLLLANIQQVGLDDKTKYDDYLKMSSSYEQIIQRDISRTYPENDFFKDDSGPGQQRLYNVMKAYSVFDEEVGYCQGSAFIVGLLLLQLDEVEAFVLLCKIMHDYKMREIYKPLMAELELLIHQLECLVQELMPELYNHLQAQNFHTSMYSSAWFLTLFTSTFSLELSNRIMDLFLIEGLDIVFKLSIAILEMCKLELLQQDNIEGLLSYFQKDMPQRAEANIDCLFESAFKVVYDSKKMKKLCKSFITNIKKDQEELIELRRLRTENRLLQDRLKALEDESKELADKLIKGQVSRAQEAEHHFVIKRELSQLKTSDSERSILIEKAEERIAELEKILANRTIHYSNEAQTLIKALQEELVAVKLREAENHVEINNLLQKLADQDLLIKTMRENVPEDPVAQLQEELSAVKMREAEAVCAVKELQAKFDNIQKDWLEIIKHSSSNKNSLTINNNSSQPCSLDQSNSSSSTASSNIVDVNNTCQTNTSLTNQQSLQSNSVSQPLSLTMALANSLPITKLVSSVMKRNGPKSASCIENEQAELVKAKEELYSLKLREAKLTTEVQILRTREMELETNCKIHENKLRRKEVEAEKINQELNLERDKLERVTNQLRDEQCKLSDLEWTRREDQMMRRMKDVEHTRLVGELKQKISSLEVRIEEINAEKKLAEIGIEPKDASELQERMAELQTESFRLEVSNKKVQDLEASNLKLDAVYGDI